jgi:hypothetical protein
MAAKSPDVSDNIRKSIDQARFKDVSISQDRDKSSVTLGGQVMSEKDKSQTEAITDSFARALVVADQTPMPPWASRKKQRPCTQIVSF